MNKQYTLLWLFCTLSINKPHREWRQQQGPPNIYVLWQSDSSSSSFLKKKQPTKQKNPLPSLMLPQWFILFCFFNNVCTTLYRFISSFCKVVIICETSLRLSASHSSLSSTAAGTLKFLKKEELRQGGGMGGLCQKCPDLLHLPIMLHGTN